MGLIEVTITLISEDWSNEMNYSDDDILAEIDKYTQPIADPYFSRFPKMLGNEDHIFHIAARLTAYRNNRHWALIIEHLHYCPRSGGPEAVFLQICPFGNCLPKYPKNPVAYQKATVIRPIKYFPPRRDDDDIFWEYIPDYVEAVELRNGDRIPIPRDRKRYAALGIKLYCEELHLPKAIRAICATHREKLLATNEDLRQHVPPSVPEFLRLNDWFHPFIHEDDRPSWVRTFQQLAAAISSGNPEVYEAPGTPTCHWRFWQDALEMPENDLDDE